MSQTLMAVDPAAITQLEGLARQLGEADDRATMAGPNCEAAITSRDLGARDAMAFRVGYLSETISNLRYQCQRAIAVLDNMCEGLRADLEADQ